MIIDIYKINAEKSGDSIELDDEIFNTEPNHTAIFLAVKAYLANQRQGTHKTKERNEVRGGGRKPWSQKSKGGARAGTSRSPLWVGGGTVFGPRPRTYTQNLNKKVIKLARKSAFSLKLRNEQMIIVDEIKLDAPKTSDLYKIIKAFNLVNKKTLILTNGKDENIYKSGRNISNLRVLEAQKASTYDLLNNQVVMILKSTINEIEKTFINK
ncbi:MAG: 50S ribosomal protein L4 [Ignavibacteria bacterium]